MFVLCPHCQFLVALDPATGEPPLRCPRCGGAVQPAIAPTPSAAFPGDAARAHPPPAGESRIAAPQDKVAIIENGTPAPPVSAESATKASDAGEDVATTPAVAAQAPPGPHTRAPSFVSGEAANASLPAGRSRWWIPASLAGLTLLLLLQIVFADRAQLASDARWRPLLLHGCAVLRCSLPPWREVGAITLLDRDVRPDPRRPGVLHATASFRNDARWPQPWPMLLLTLSDADGHVTGARMFAPSEYLQATHAAATQNGLASGQGARVALDVFEPGPRTVAFTFDFR